VSAKTKSLYGFSPKLAPFVGKTPSEQVALLQSWSNTVIFGGYQNRAFVDAVHEAGLHPTSSGVLAVPVPDAWSSAALP